MRALADRHVLPLPEDLAGDWVSQSTGRTFTAVRVTGAGLVLMRHGPDYTVREPMALRHRSAGFVRASELPSPVPVGMPAGRFMVLATIGMFALMALGIGLSIVLPGS